MPTAISVSLGSAISEASASSALESCPRAFATACSALASALASGGSESRARACSAFESCTRAFATACSALASALASGGSESRASTSSALESWPRAFATACSALASALASGGSESRASACSALTTCASDDSIDCLADAMAGRVRIGLEGVEAQLGEAQLHLGGLDPPAARRSRRAPRARPRRCTVVAALHGDGGDDPGGAEAEVGAALGLRRAGQIDRGAQLALDGFGALRLGDHLGVVGLEQHERGRRRCGDRKRGNQHQPAPARTAAADQQIDVNVAHGRLSHPDRRIWNRSAQQCTASHNAVVTSRAPYVTFALGSKG